MSKISIEDVSATLRQYKVDEEKRQDIIKALENAIEEEKVEKAAAKTPRKKSIFFLVSTAEGKSQYLFKCAEDYDFTKLSEAFDKVRVAYHNTKKGQKNPAKTNELLIELAKKKFWKEQKIVIVKQEPILGIIVENK